MASQEEIRLQREQNELLREQNNLLKSQKTLTEENQENLRISRDINNEIREGLKLVSKEVDLKSAIRRSLTSINKIAQENYKISELDLDVLTSRSKIEKLQQDLGKTRRDLLRDEADLSKVIENLEKEKVGANEDQTIELNKQIIAAKKVQEAVSNQISSSKEYTKNLVQAKKVQEEISKISSPKGFEFLSEFIQKIPGLSAFSGDFKNASKDATEVVAKMAKINSQRIAMGKTPMFSKGTMNFKALGAGFKSLGPIITKTLGPLALLSSFVLELARADKETVELQKSMSLTRREAVKFRQELTIAADKSGDINITSTKLLETFSNLNKQFGFITNFATDTLVTMTKLTKVVGIGAESAGNLAAASFLTGGSFEDNYKDVLATSYELQRQSGVQMDLRDILEQSGKVTGTVRANLGANPALIAKAITQAKLFGASLNDVADAGKALLNFEQSIEAELQAELLLGKNINLERARAAALAGDQVTLAQELQKEAGNFEEFTRMNVIQQEALAQAMGMTSDKLADILFQQEIQGKTARELRAIGKDELADRLESQTAAAKFTAAMEKLKSVVTDVVVAFTPILDIVGSIASFIGQIISALGPFKQVLGAAATGAAAGSIIPGVGTAAGAIVGGIGGLLTMNDGIIPAGYGDTIIKKGKDTIALNNQDTVVAGTNLGKGTDMSETNQLLKMLVRQNDKKPEISPVGLYQVQ